MDEYSVILSYTPINVDSLIELFDEYNNLNWDYTEEFSSGNFIKYILVWIITDLVLKPYFISFNHLVAITYIFSSKQLVTYTQWNDEDDIIDIF